MSVEFKGIGMACGAGLGTVPVAGERILLNPRVDKRIGSVIDPSHPL